MMSMIAKRQPPGGGDGDGDNTPAVTAAVPVDPRAAVMAMLNKRQGGTVSGGEADDSAVIKEADPLSPEEQALVEMYKSMLKMGVPEGSERAAQDEERTSQ
jgi:hypothetical protein